MRDSSKPKGCIARELKVGRTPKVRPTRLRILLGEVLSHAEIEVESATIQRARPTERIKIKI